MAKDGSPNSHLHVHGASHAAVAAAAAAAIRSKHECTHSTTGPESIYTRILMIRRRRRICESRMCIGVAHIGHFLQIKSLGRTSSQVLCCLPHIASTTVCFSSPPSSRFVVHSTWSPVPHPLLRLLVNPPPATTTTTVILPHPMFVLLPSASPHAISTTKLRRLSSPLSRPTRCPLHPPASSASLFTV